MVSVYRSGSSGYLGDHGKSKQVADAADDGNEDLSAVTLP